MFSTSLFSYCVRLLGNWHEAEDILAETFTKLARSDLKKTGSLKAWLFRVATNACYKVFRKRKQECMFSQKIIEAHVNDHGPDLVREMQVQRLLQTLPENQRVVIVLKFYEQLKYREIADVLCCPVGTVKSRIHEGINNLKKNIKKRRIR
jgi:RNA polymerase sigma factor (sigma-70 family)